jgi:hypothetical protein
MIRARLKPPAQLALVSPSLMLGSVTLSVRSPDFQRAFVAMRYFWGARGAALEDALESAALQPATADTLRALHAPERAERARALGVELGRLAAALDQRGLWR